MRIARVPISSVNGSACIAPVGFPSSPFLVIVHGVCLGLIFVLLPGFVFCTTRTRLSADCVIYLFLSLDHPPQMGYSIVMDVSGVPTIVARDITEFESEEPSAIVEAIDWLLSDGTAIIAYKTSACRQIICIKVSDISTQFRLPVVQSFLHGPSELDQAVLLVIHAVGGPVPCRFLTVFSAAGCMVRAPLAPDQIVPPVACSHVLGLVRGHALLSSDSVPISFVMLSGTSQPLSLVNLRPGFPVELIAADDSEVHGVRQLFPLSFSSRGGAVLVVSSLSSTSFLTIGSDDPDESITSCLVQSEPSIFVGQFRSGAVAQVLKSGVQFVSKGMPLLKYVSDRCYVLLQPCF
jgi:hypothetical protein